MIVQDLIFLGAVLSLTLAVLLVAGLTPIADFIADWELERWKRKRKKPFLDKMKRDLEMWRKEQEEHGNV